MNADRNYVSFPATNILKTMVIPNNVLIFPAQLLVPLEACMSKSFSSMVTVCFGNLVTGNFRSFSQYPRKLMVFSMHSVYRLVSPYTMWFCVLLLTHSSLLQGKSCADLMTDTLDAPHISDANNSTGLI